MPRISERRQIREITSQVSAVIGAEFFTSLTKQLADALSADLVLVGEFLGGRVERLRVLAACEGGKPSEVPDQELAGTLAARVAAGETCAYLKAVQSRFPADKLLAELPAQAAVATPLFDPQRQVIGALVTLYRRSLTNSRVEKSMLEIFAPRAAAELRRKQEESALRESAQRYRAFIAQNADAMWRVEFEKAIPTNLPEDEQIEEMFRSGYLAECNDAMARLLGYDAAGGAVGVPFEQLARQADPHLREHLQSAIQSGYRSSTVETEPVDQEGVRRCMLRTHWGVIENGGLQRIWGTLRDITALRKAEAALHDSERRIAKLLESIHLLALTLDEKGAITFCNDYLLQLTGWDASDLAGKSWFDLLVPPNEREKLQAAFAAAKKKAPVAHQFESTLLAKNGRRWVIAWEGSVLRDSTNSIVGFAGVGRDVTLYQALETGLRQTETLRNIKRTTRVIADELSTVLTVVSGHCAMLLDSTTSGTEDVVRDIQGAAVNGMALIQQLRVFGGDAIHAAPFDINELIEEVLNTLRPFLCDDTVLTTELDPFADLVHADRSQILQLLLTLGLNARDAMPDGGTLLISSAHLQVDGQSTHDRLQSGDYVQVCISDTGPSRAEEARAFIMEPFLVSDLADNRSGPSFLTMAGIVQQSGGKIVVNPEGAKGTTIEIYLPRVEAD